MGEKFKEVDIQRWMGDGQEGDDEKPRCCIGIRLILYSGGDAKEKENKEEYMIRIWLGGRFYIRRYTLSQIMGRRFLQEIGIYIQGEAKFYEKLRKEILQMKFSDEYISYVTDRNGLQTVNDKRIYVFGNGSISTTGFHPEITSIIGGICFPPDRICERDGYIRCVQQLFHVYQENPVVFYPTFFMNIMGITSGFFRYIGEDSFMRLTLWLDGASGSGKTEIAKAGIYAFNDDECSMKIIESVTGKRKNILTMMLQASGGVCIVDDVKKENVRERKSSVGNNVDDCLRSVFQGYLTDSVSSYMGHKKIDCCAVITGEYLDTCESQNARMIYMKVDGFLKDRKNSEALRRLQEQPKLLTSVCGGYIQFLLEKMEESSFPKLVKAKLKEMREMTKIYQGIGNAERLDENRCMLEMAAWLAEEYFRYIGLQDSFISDFHRNADKSIEEVMDATFYLLGGGQMLLTKVMERISVKAKVRKAYYQDSFRTAGRKSKWKYHQECFWMNRGDDFVWIEDYKRSMQKNEQEYYCRHEENPALIIRKERLEELFHQEIQDILKEKAEISSKLVVKVENRFWKMLREMQMIYQIPRIDSELGRPAAEYPVFIRYTMHCENDFYSNEKPTYLVRFESVVQINTEHICMEGLKDRIRKLEAEPIFEDTTDFEIMDEKEENVNAEDIYEKRRKFMRGKSLYKK